MKIKNVLSSMMGIACLHAPLKAQIKLPENLKIFSEVGVAAPLKDEFILLRGANIEFKTYQNKLSTFLGAAVTPQKKGTFVGTVTNDYEWNKYPNLSTFGRGIVAYSKRLKSAAVEFAPVKFNFPMKKWNVSFAPAFSFIQDFSNKKSTAGLSAIFQSSYSVTSRDKLLIETDYNFLSGKNSKNLKFNSPAENVLYKITYQRFF